VTIALLIYLIVGGFVVGGLARLAVPGPDPMPWWQTVLLGWLGSILGGLVSRIFLGYTGGIIFSLLGAIVLLILYRRFVQHRPLTGPGARRSPPQR
jgi:uncharacterized membrane protein YeaQ/YmgE (transglycosylase-associated protein family)